MGLNIDRRSGYAVALEGKVDILEKIWTRSTYLTLFGGWLMGIAFGVASLNIARPDIAVLLKAWSGFLPIPGLVLIVWASSMRRRAVAALG